MRSRVLLFSLVLTASSLALPHLVHAAAIPFFGPIIDKSWFVAGTNPPIQCPLGWGAVIVVINNIIRLLLTLAILFVAPVMIAYSGFLFVVNPVSPGGMAKAKSILLNTIVGIVIALAAWPIIDAVMAVLYHPNPSDNFVQNWANIITSGSEPACLPQVAAPPPGSGAGTFPGAGAPPPSSTPPIVVPPAGVGRFTFNRGINAEVPTESSALAGLLSCMSNQLTSNAIITSISDSVITNGVHTMQACAVQGKAIGCHHTANSCHYGGRNCVGSSYAVDLAGDLNALTTIARTCGASALNESNHLHVSVGAQNNCGCDASLE